MIKFTIYDSIIKTFNFNNISPKFCKVSADIGQMAALQTHFFTVTDILELKTARTSTVQKISKKETSQRIHQGTRL